MCVEYELCKTQYLSGSSLADSECMSICDVMIGFDSDGDILGNFDAFLKLFDTETG